MQYGLVCGVLCGGDGWEEKGIAAVGGGRWAEKKREEGEQGLNVTDL